jgi:hypothetical protein
LGFNLKARKEFGKRSSERGRERGRLFEQEVLKILERMVTEGKLVSAIYNAPNSKEDSEGKDFTVGKVVNGAVLYRSFGVSTSLRYWSNSRIRHPGIPQFCFPTGTNPGTIEKRVLSLFS